MTPRASRKTTMNVYKAQRAVFFTHCVNFLVQDHLLHQDYVNVVNGKTMYNFVNIRTNYEKNQDYINMNRKPSVYVIEEGHQSLYESVKILANYTNFDFNPRATFIFVASNFSTEFMELLSFYFVMNAIFLNSLNGDLSTYTWRMHNVVNDEVMKIGSCLNISSIVRLPTYVQRGWKNTPVDIVYHSHKLYTTGTECKLKGLEIEIVEVILDHLKVEPRFSLSKENIQKLDAFYSDFDIYIGGIIHSQRDFFMDNTMSYVDDYLAFFVPTESPLPRWKYILRIFTPATWLFWIGTIFLMALVGAIPSSPSSIAQRTPVFKYLFLGVLKLILEQNHRVRSDLNHIRVLNVLMFFVAVNFNNLAKSRMTYILNGVNTESSIDDIEGIIQSNLDIGLPPGMERFLEDDQRLYQYWKNHKHKCDFDMNCFFRTAFKKDLITFKGVRKSRFEDSLIDNTTGKWLLKQLPQLKVPVSVFGQFKRGHPMFRAFNKNLHRLFESGIVSEIVSKYDKVRDDGDVVLDVHRLDVEDIAAPVFLWLIGMLAGCIVFIWEVFFKERG